MKKIAILISGRGSNAKAVADECFNGNIPGEIVCYGSDNDDAKGLLFARENNIATFAVDYKKIIAEYNADPEGFKVPEDFDYDDVLSKISFIPVKNKERFLKTRARAEEEIFNNIMEFKPDVLVLAGFMRTLTPYFIDKFSKNSLDPRIMNIHPAILPSFPGVDGYGDTFFYGCKKAGCTVHFVDYGTDSGPVIVQRAFDILPGDSLDDVKKKGLNEEWTAYPEAVKLFCSDKLNVEEISREVRGRVEKRKVVRISN